MRPAVYSFGCRSLALPAVLCLAFGGFLHAETPTSGKSFSPLAEIDRPVELPTNAFATVPGKDPNDWSFTLEPYLWALAMSGEVGVKGSPAVSIDYKAKGILQHLDWGLMAKAELRKGRWGLLGDGLFAQLSASSSTPGPLYTGANLQVQQGMTSLALAYRVIDDRRGFLDVYAGARFNYLGFNLSGDTDSEGISGLSETIVQRISSRIESAVQARVQQAIPTLEAEIASRIDALESRIVQTVKETQETVETAVTEKALTAAATTRTTLEESLTPAKVAGIMRDLRKNSGAYRQMVAATAEVRVAEAQLRVSEGKAAASDLAQEVVSRARDRVADARDRVSKARGRLESAQKKLARDLARRIEEALPTDIEGNQWWVDPIVGLRGQINITRWLFLALQGDVGGFGAGSNIAWNAQGSIGVNITRHVFVEAGWRYFYMDYANDGALYKAAEYGLFSGIGVKF